MGRKPRPQIECNHDYPIVVMIVEGECRAHCLGCQAVGPPRNDPDAAERALLKGEEES